MAKHKRRFTPAQKRERKRRREKFMTIFVHGKQKRVKRPATIDGIDAKELSPKLKRSRDEHFAERTPADRQQRIGHHASGGAVLNPLPGPGNHRLTCGYIERTSVVVG